MHHNLKIEIERVNTQYVAQIELSTSGRAGRDRLSADTFDEIMDKLKARYADMLGAAQGFHAGAPVANITHHSEGATRPVEQVKDVQAAPKDKKGGKKGKRAKAAPKDKPRKFASE